MTDPNQVTPNRTTPAYNTPGDTTPGGTTPRKEPREWATGGEPATAPQMAYLETLAHDTGAEVPRDLTKACASELIDELRAPSPRVGDGPVGSD